MQQKLEASNLVDDGQDVYRAMMNLQRLLSTYKPSDHVATDEKKLEDLTQELEDLKEHCCQLVGEKKYWIQQCQDLKERQDKRPMKGSAESPAESSSNVNSISPQIQIRLMDDSPTEPSLLSSNVNAPYGISSHIQRMDDRLPADGKTIQDNISSPVGSPPSSPMKSQPFYLGTESSATYSPFSSVTSPLGTIGTDDSSMTDDRTVLKPQKPRAAFRLLQCSDEKCEIFRPKTGKIRISHQARSNVQMIWDEPPTQVLVVKKPNDPVIEKVFVEIVEWLVTQKHLQVWIEPVVQAELKLPCARTWKRSMNDNGNTSNNDATSDEWLVLQRCIDFVICLGGDGTILWLSRLFERSIPPLISFAMGSLGFLTPFKIEHHQAHLDRILVGGFNISLRSRLTVHLVRHSPESQSEQVPPMDEPNDDDHHHRPPLVLMRNRSTSKLQQPVEDDTQQTKEDLQRMMEMETLHALNEVVVDRGPSAAVVELDCYCDDVFLTKVTADGIIIATPTGSTAYSLSAGGSMVHPSVPSMLFTPICPHSLSFRPLLFHDSATIKITVPLTARTSAYLSLDGANRMEMHRGDTLYVQVSGHPLPLICHTTENADWFASVKTNLNWNQRRDQKPLKHHRPTTPGKT